MTRSPARRLALALLAALTGACGDGEGRRTEAPGASSVEPPAASPPARATTTATSSSAAASASAQRQLTSLGAAVDQQALLDAPVITLKNGELLLDDQLVLNKGALAAHGDKLHRIEPLFLQLKAMRERWNELHPDQPFPGVLIIDVEESARAVLVKSVFQTAAHAGYPNVSFVVKKPPAATTP